jgi:hypothetical protein
VAAEQVWRQLRRAGSVTRRHRGSRGNRRFAATHAVHQRRPQPQRTPGTELAGVHPPAQRRLRPAQVRAEEDRGRGAERAEARPRAAEDEAPDGGPPPRTTAAEGEGRRRSPSQRRPTCGVAARSGIAQRILRVVGRNESTCKSSSRSARQRRRPDGSQPPGGAGPAAGGTPAVECRLPGSSRFIGGVGGCSSIAEPRLGLEPVPRVPARGPRAARSRSTAHP